MKCIKPIIPGLAEAIHVHFDVKNIVLAVVFGRITSKDEFVVLDDNPSRDIHK